MSEAPPTWLQAARGGGPAHEWRDGAHHGAQPGVADAQPLHGGVAAGVEEDVERPQQAGQGIDRQRQQSHARDAAGQGEGDGVEWAGGGGDQPLARAGRRHQQEVQEVQEAMLLVPDLSPNQRAVPGSVHVGVKRNLKVLRRQKASIVTLFFLHCDC